VPKVVEEAIHLSSLYMTRQPENLKEKIRKQFFIK
jgi:hypothetical protein